MISQSQSHKMAQRDVYDGGAQLEAHNLRQQQPQEQRGCCTEKRESVDSNCDLLQQATKAAQQKQQQQQQLANGRTTSEIEADKIAHREPKWWRRTRMHVALLGLTIAAVNCYAQATFCIAIVEMVLPADYIPTNTTKDLTDTLSSTTTAPTATTLHNATATLLAASSVTGQQQQPDEDESCPVEYKYRHYYDRWRFPSSSSNNNNNNWTSSIPVAPSSQTIDVSQRFNWDAGRQGLLLGAFAFGTAPLQVVGGRLAELYGAKWVLLAGCIGTALTNLTIPILARWSFLMLLANRVLMGVAQAGMEPGLMCFLAEWLTPSEAGFFISMLLFAICAGFFLGSLLSSFILALGYGWSLAYYVSGGLNLLVGLAWFWYADSWPQASRHISASELALIKQEQAKARPPERQHAEPSEPEDSSPSGSLASLETSSRSTTITACVGTAQAPKEQCAVHCGDTAHPNENQNQNQQQKQQCTQSAPWASILSTRSVWAFIICKVSIRWCADVISNELPTYLANVLHLSIEINGLLNSVSSALFAICSFLTGWLVNEISLKRCYALQPDGTRLTTKTNLRKIFQSSASFGSALAVFLMTRYDCNLLFSMSMLLLVSCCLVMGTGGELQIPYDMTSRYPGTLHGMACTLSVSGWLAPPLIGLILGDRPSSRQRWRTVWYLTAAINLIGGLVFVLFADASPRDFDKKRQQTKLAKKTGQQPTSGRPESAAYANAACSPPSTCNNSPKLQLAAPKKSSLPDGQELYFDEKPIRVRQTSESFSAALASATYPASHSSFSPLVDIGLVFPYQEKPTPKEDQDEAAVSAALQQKQQQKGNLLLRVWRLLAARIRDPSLGADEHRPGARNVRPASQDSKAITHL